MEDKVNFLDTSEEFYMERAENRFERGDYLGTLKLLNERAERYDPSADASALYADVYEALGLYQLCADAWFRFLDTCNEADFQEGYEGLANAFLNMGDEMQSSVFVQKMFDADDGSFKAPDMGPDLRLVHSDDGEDGEELLREGIESLRTGDLESARASFSEVKPESKSYSAASGLNAMCLLLSGDVEGAANECETLISHQPENVQALTTYCAVLGAMGKHEEAKKIGKRLSQMDTDSTEELFRIATALCETGLDEEAYEKLNKLKERIPYGEEILFFHAAASYRTGRLEEAISSLETMVLIDPRKAIARYYLERLREKRDDPEAEVPMGYFYRLPESERDFVCAFFKRILKTDQEQAAELGALPSAFEYFRIAFDHLDGRDEELQSLAAEAAVKSRCEKFVREILLDANVGMQIKIEILTALVARNEENSFGIVICNFYREFFTHELELGGDCPPFLEAFSEVYTKYYLLNEDFEEKLLGAGEEVFESIEGTGTREFFEEKNALCAVIFREARLQNVRRPIEDIAEAFDADVKTVKRILDCIL